MPQLEIHFLNYDSCTIFSFRWEKSNLPDNVDARQDTTAVEIFRRCNNDMLNPMLTTINRRGNNGAPSHPVVIQERIIQNLHLYYLNYNTSDI